MPSAASSFRICVDSLESGTAGASLESAVAYERALGAAALATEGRSTGTSSLVLIDLDRAVIVVVNRFNVQVRVELSTDDAWLGARFGRSRLAALSSLTPAPTTTSPSLHSIVLSAQVCSRFPPDGTGPRKSIDVLIGLQPSR